MSRRHVIWSLPVTLPLDDTGSLSGSHPTSGRHRITTWITTRITPYDSPTQDHYPDHTLRIDDWTPQNNCPDHTVRLQRKETRSFWRLKASTASSIALDTRPPTRRRLALSPLSKKKTYPETDMKHFRVWKLQGVPKKMGLVIFKLEMVINQLYIAQILKTSLFSESAESRLCDGSSKNGEYWFLIGVFL